MPPLGSPEAITTLVGLSAVGAVAGFSAVVAELGVAAAAVFAACGGAAEGEELGSCGGAVSALSALPFTRRGRTLSREVFGAGMPRDPFARSCAAFSCRSRHLRRSSRLQKRLQVLLSTCLPSRPFALARQPAHVILP